MITCLHCHNSGRPTLYLCTDGWAGCVRARIHWGISKQDSQEDALAELEQMSGLEIDDWDVVRVEQSGQGRLL